MATATTPLTRTDAEDLLYTEAALLDDRRFDQWLEMFTDDAVYWVPARFGPSDPSRQSSFIYDDRPRMGDRVWRLSEGPAHAQIPPSATRHLVSNVQIVEADDLLVTVRSNFAIFESRKDVLRTFAGDYLHQIRREPDGWKFSSKKATLVNLEAPIFNLTFMI
jgi:benzoate/toluate 1,2-dioxygenase subunit beta